MSEDLAINVARVEAKLDALVDYHKERQTVVDQKFDKLFHYYEDKMEKLDGRLKDTERSVSMIKGGGVIIGGALSAIWAAVSIFGSFFHKGS